MRIALVAHHVRPGGGQDRYLLELARHLSRRHEVHLIAIHAEGLEGLGVAVHRVHVRERPVLWTAPRFAARAQRIARRLGCDITHAVGGCMPGANVITAQYVHAEWSVLAKRYKVLAPGLVGRLYQRRVARQSEWYDRLAYGHAALRSIIAVSRRIAGELEHHYAVAAPDITVIPNGVDPQLFDASLYPGARAELRRALSLPEDALVALLMGTYARKGLETAVAAVAKASPSLHLVVAGSGDVDLAQRWAHASGLERRLHLVGPRGDPERLFAAADVFVLPTRYEPFGMVIVEAMASALPVVVSATAGAAEHIRHGGNGFLVERPDDVDGFAEAIRTALESGNRNGIGRAARLTALDLTWPRICEQTEAVYDGAVKAARMRRRERDGA